VIVIPARRALAWGGLIAWAASVAAAAEGQLAPRPADKKKITQQAISLRDLKADLAAPDAPLFYGATSLRGFIFREDEDGKDCILLTFVEPDEPALRAEDFAVAYQNVSGGHQRPACTINPRAETLQGLSKLEREIRAAASSSAIEALLAKWRRLAGSPQDVIVFGVPANTHFAKVMVDADYELKSVCNGAERIEGLVALTQRCLDGARAEIASRGVLAGAKSSFNRFWFNPGSPALYRTDESRSVILGKCPVVLLTEEEAVTAGGGLAGKKLPDPLAKRFAADFTARYPAIAGRKPLYRELENLYRFVALVDLLLKAAPDPGTKNLVRDFVAAVRIMRYPFRATLNGKFSLDRLEVVQRTPEGLRHVQLWLPSCGGVSVDVHPHLIAHRLPDPQGLVPAVTRAVVAARPSRHAAHWAFRSEALLKLAN
jgi:hypothetical protein